jgi:hypothetical protein
MLDANIYEVIIHISICGHQISLHITRKKWLNEDTRQVVYRDWNLVANRTRVTREFVSFLKEMTRSKP